MIYLFYTIYLLIKQPTDIFTLDEGTLYSEETDIGYVIRDEVVIQGENYKNGMEKIKSEGEIFHGRFDFEGKRIKKILSKENHLK